MVKVNSIRTVESFSFFQKIEYLHNDENGTLIYSNNQKFYFKERSLYIVNYLCKLHLTSIKAYYDGVKISLNYHYNLPIYLNEALILISTSNIQSYDNIWFNYENVLSFEVKAELIIYFKSGNQLRLNKKMGFIKKQEEKLAKILKHLKQVTR